MRSLSDTIRRLNDWRNAAENAAAEGDRGPLEPFRAFGSNPGQLDALSFVPPGMKRGAGLVVVLHGCTQNAAGYDRGAGWSALAARHGFAVLLPQQRRSNNSNLCFNWFSPADARRGRGEALSIRQMVLAMIERQAIDPARVFVTGLSAGGAMTSVMLAAYPELFAGGAVIAGLAFGSANSVPEALDRMRGHGGPADAHLARLAAAASRHRGPWPTLSVWHGSSDATVVPSNADRVVEQWRALHGVAAKPAEVEIVDGQQRQVWRDAAGREVIEQFAIAGMGHGTPLDTRGSDGTGAAGPYMLEADISSTDHIARFWGLIGNAATKPAAPVKAAPKPPAPSRAEAPRPVAAQAIEDALRAAGLLR